MNILLHARAWAGAMGVVAVVAAQAQSAKPVAFQQPSAAVREVLDAPALPTREISPDHRRLALFTQRRYASAEDLARPMHKLAGLRWDMRTDAPVPRNRIESLQIRPLLEPGAAPLTIKLPAGGAFHSFSWAPDGLHFVLARATDQGTELWVGDAQSGALKPVPGLRLNLVLGSERSWLSPGELVVLAVPAKRGAPPATPKSPVGPVVQESMGRASPDRTYPDLLKSAHDEALFDHFTRSQPVKVRMSDLATQVVGPVGQYTNLTTLGQGHHLMTERLQRPYSYTLPVEDFPRVFEVLDLQSRQVVRELGKRPLKQGVSITGVLTGPRAFFASPTKDAAVYWVEALDGGELSNKVPHRDRLMRLDAPYTGHAREVHKLVNRFTRLVFAEDGQHALVTDFDRDASSSKTEWVSLQGGADRVLFELNVKDRYNHPGNPLMDVLPNGRPVARLDAKGQMLLVGQGASQKGDRPFLDRFSVVDGSRKRLFQSGDVGYEQPVAVLDEQADRIVTLRESATEPPNLVLRQGVQLTQSQALTQFKDPAPILRKIRRELVKFRRADGVELSFWMYLPPDYKEGERRPTFVWAYPLEFTDAGTAGQVSGSSQRFVSFAGASPLMLLLDGYVVLNDATMPIVGDPKTVNDKFIEQITMNARAIVDKATDLGVTDPKRVAVGGHSYGAFMTANLLAHTQIFKTGIARSGAYNRTLTPFGFQSEQRMLWEAKDVYLKLSPFLFADKLREPILLIHGDSDNNPGTFPIQTERLYQALAGTGGQVRYVSLPNESHGYASREAIGHVIWEMSEWLKRHLGDPHGNARN